MDDTSEYNNITGQFADSLLFCAQISFKEQMHHQCLEV